MSLRITWLAIAPLLPMLKTFPSVHRRIMVAGLVATSATPWMLACSRTPAAPLRIGAHSWPGYETLFLARELDVLDADEVRLIEMPAPSDSLNALVAHEIEGAALTLDETLRARAEGLDLRGVLVFDVSAGADVLLARPPLKELRDIAGRRVGLDTSAVGALMLDAALRDAGLELADVRVVQVTMDRHVDAFREGDVDALISGEPIAGQLESQGARRLFDSSSIPGLIVDVLAVRSTALDTHADALRSLLAGHFKALAHLKNQPEDSARRLAPRMQLPPEDVPKAFRGIELPGLAANREWLAGPQPRLQESAAMLQKLMLANGLLTRAPLLAGPLADGRFLPKAG